MVSNSTRVLTINVTSLTKARLQTILENSMADDDVNIIALQEIRQQSTHPRWIINLAKKAGFSCACSTPPPRGSRVAVVQ
eukprot:6805221-Pyramimonas_sp.AAC.1